MRTRIALWNFARRDPSLLLRFPHVIDELAQHLSEQQGGAMIRYEQARERNLPNLAAADRWWKRQWRLSSREA